MSHSPGPWRWTRGRRELTRNTTDEEKRVLAKTTAFTAWADTPILDIGQIIPTEADAALIQRSPEMAEMLRELEWQENPAYETFHCPACDGFKPPGIATGHTPDCRLAALLRELP